MNVPKAPPLEVGTRVGTPDGPGRVVGWHSSRTWVFGRLEVKAYVIVDVDDVGRRLYPSVLVTAESSAELKGAA